tara:strand:+ start:1111 stop:1926 length:816 start_codon:yes stop_codon:yes gene_type:complete
MKHNKKRNTAFLYECLIKELTKSVIRNNAERKYKIVNIIKENFKKGSALKAELNIYRSIIECKKLPQEFAQRLLTETKKDFQNLDRKQVFNEQTRLIKQINETLSSVAFANFISNYKDIASIGQFLQGDGLKAKNRLLVESRVLTLMVSDKKTEPLMKHVDNLTYKTFTDKFNETYSRTLRQEQKDLLTNYIVSFSDNGLGLKSFLNEEILRLKVGLMECTKNEKLAKNEAFLAKIEQVLGKLENFKNERINEDMVRDVFYIQDLIGEVSK